MSALPAPPPLVRREELSPSWFTRALRHGGVLPEGEVASATSRPIGTGQVADTLLFTLTYKSPLPTGSPTSVIVKVPADDPGSRGAGVAHRLYEREVRFYQEIAPHVKSRVPRCFYSEIDTVDGSFILVLEDVSPAATRDQIVGVGLDDAQEAMVQAAGLHGPVWGDPRLENLNWLNFVRANGARNAQELPPLTEAFVGRYEPDLEPEAIALLLRLNARARAFWTRTIQAGPLTVVHGDFRPDNMLVGAHDGEFSMIVVDWQTINHACGLIDVAFLLGTALDVDLRRRHEEDLVRRYHACLLEHGVLDYDWPRCWEDYRRFASYAIYFLTPAAVMVERTDRGDAMFLAMVERAVAQITDLQTERLLDEPS